MDRLLYVFLKIFLVPTMREVLNTWQKPKRQKMKLAEECVYVMISINKLFLSNIWGCINQLPETAKDRAVYICKNQNERLHIEHHKHLTVIHPELCIMQGTHGFSTPLSLTVLRHRSVRKPGTDSLQGSNATPQEVCSPSSYKNLVLQGTYTRQQQQSAARHCTVSSCSI